MQFLRSHSQVYFYLFFAACSQTDSTGSVILSATVPRASFDVDSDAALTTDEKTFTLEVSLTGGYKETQSQTVSLEDNSKTFEFQEVPADTLLKVTAKLLQGKETLYTGESERFIVKPGENLVKISMKKGDGEETIWVVLWNRAEKEQIKTSGSNSFTTGMNIFNLNAISDESKITESERLSTNISDSICFSDNGDLYILEHYITENSKVYNIAQYTKTSAGYKEGNYLNLTPLMEKANATSYTPSEISIYGDYIYVMWTIPNNEIYTTKIEGINLSNFADTESFETIKTINNFKATHIAITDGLLFATNGTQIYQFEFTAGQNQDLQVSNATQIQTDELPKASASITALNIVNGNLYGLAAWTQMDKTSKGYVFKIDISTMSLQSWSNGNKLFGWNDSETATPHGSNDYFFYPTRFIATSPKKLVIADDGYRESTGSDDTDPKNENRVVIIDLETESMSATNVGVMFDNQNTGCGVTQAN
ncbi:hypothetical protein [Treponema zioleckii]|uniref:hypothetical protein n=1 Tax=Treponema zioleckii TaxID=331680 RepID=UPI00168BD327|nr:hypothetical protein [Treponema zioleckii]